MSHINANKAKLRIRVRRIQGQLNAVEAALADEVSCADLLQQVAAVRGAVGGLMEELVLDHLAHHVADPKLSGPARAAGTAELITVLRRYMK